MLQQCSSIRMRFAIAVLGWAMNGGRRRVLQEKIPSVEVTGDIILGTSGYDAGRLGRDAAALALLCCAYLAITFLLLKYRRSA